MTRRHFDLNPNAVLNIIAVAKHSREGAKIAACEAQGIETMQATKFIVARDDLQQCKVIETQLPDMATLADEALLVKVTRFAFTANNITYAVLGDHLRYWQLFPAPEGFGNVPVWGLGEVIASKHPAIATGETLFGYFPMATHLVIETADVSKRGLRDGAAHRQGVAPTYNAYTRVSGDPAFAGKQGDYQALLRPLFMLSFLVDDFLAENEFFGAKAVMLSSASSKTAYGLAHLLHARGNGMKVIGLTSAGNTSFVTSLGCYDEVVTYDDVTSLPTNFPVAYVDMAGNTPLRTTLHQHFGDQMKYSGIIGLTHRMSSPDDAAQALPGVKPQFFFAPDQIRKRTKELGPAGFNERFAAAWSGFAPNLDRWMKVIEHRGPAAVQRAYLDTLNGRVPPDQGLILSL
jgi:NOL1/NOP2/fmu family ribosome biogenesis protein